MYLLLAFIATILLLILAVVLTFGTIPSWRTVRLFNKLPGPTHFPFFIGATCELFQLESKDFMSWQTNYLDKYNGVVAIYMMGHTEVFISNPEDIEVILTSTKNIHKTLDYRFMKEWLNDGLFISIGDKWRRRKKLLTPSFHFKILEGSSGCMNRHWKEAVEKLLSGRGAPVDPHPILGRGALNIMGESAMGINLSQNDGVEDYVATAQRVTRDATKRASNPLMATSLYKLTTAGKMHMNDIRSLQSFTEKVIRDRKSAFKEKKTEEEVYDDLPGRKHQVFLDSLLDLSEKENLTDADIQEEVDTFMFAGLDTSSTAMEFILFHLGANPEVQEKAYQEQLEIFGLSDRDAEKDDLSKMVYLEQVIKESMRLHPPAPQIGRMLSEDAVFSNGLIVPKGVQVTLCFFHTHSNPKHFPNPDAFDPDRFSPENSKNRHPYSYIPFSSGIRNCIGQKFAMMEMKIGLSVILRLCKVTAVTRKEELSFEMLVVLKPCCPILVEINPRVIDVQT